MSTRVIGTGTTHRPALGAGRSATPSRVRPRAPRADRRLEAALQPIVDLSSGRVVGVESLARFSDLRPPDAHFAEAECAGHRLALELAAVRAGLARLGELPADAYLTLNVSPQTARSSQLAAILADAPARRLILELTEHAPVGDYAQLERGLSPLRARGMRLAVDDAGAGFASMRHVLELRPEVIKLDVSLTRGIDADPGKQEFVRALVSFARATGCTLIAEGIETEEELAAVRGLGVGCGQGFWLGRPARSVAGPWELSLPPLHDGRPDFGPADSGGAPRGRRMARMGRPAAVVLAATLAWPGIMAAAGFKAPPAGGRATTPAAAESGSEEGGSTQTSIRLPRPAAASLSRVRTILHRPVIAVRSVTPSVSPAASPGGGLVRGATGAVGGVVNGVGSVVGGVVGTVEHTLTNTLGGLLGGGRSAR